MAAVIDTVPTTKVTVPTFLQGVKNGALDESWLRSLPGESTRLDFRCFVPVSYAIQAMREAARNAGFNLRTTGRYRSYERQETLFRSRYAPGDNDGCGSKTWQGVTWYLQTDSNGRCFAMAATPGTSNHGLGLADDIAEERNVPPGTTDIADNSASESMSDALLIWLRDNAQSFGLGLETRKERWHWHWIGGNALTRRTVDVLKAIGITIPDLSKFGFTVPGATPPPPPPPPPPDGTYTVVAGDGWFAIANKLGVTVNALLAANPPATLSTVLHPGDVLNVPGGTPPSGKVVTVVFLKRAGGTAAGNWTGKASFDNRATFVNCDPTQWANLLASGQAFDYWTFKLCDSSDDVTWSAT